MIGPSVADAAVTGEAGEARIRSLMMCDDCRVEAALNQGFDPHAPDRVKTWLACADHRPFLDDFLSARGFLRRSRPLDPPATEAPEVETPETPQEPPRP